MLTHSIPGDVLVIALKPGRLANQLWLFAHFIAFARDAGITVLNPAFEDNAHHFEGSRTQPVSHYPPCRLRRPMRPIRGVYSLARGTGALAARLDPSGLCVPTVRLDHPSGFGFAHTFDLGTPGFRSLAASRRLIVVQGWQFVNGRSLAEHRDAICEYFRPTAPDRGRIGLAVSAARRGGDLLVGVHIRRGDYRSYMGGQYCFTDQTFDRVMRQAQEMFAPRRVRFLVCSDEPLSADNFSVGVTLGPGDALGDLYALSLCDYLVGPPSTFSMWASFYGTVPLFVIESSDAHLDNESLRVYESQFSFAPQ